ncbi:MAG: hypothetical protein CR993_00735 [Rhodobacterales bacterium]|nr:MAG: hypothetical protein CR993_00735 [Rhodobacterales bacterium]
MTQPTFLERYKPDDLGAMILMLSLEGFQKILPHVFLHLDDPKGFQLACYRATADVREAYYDADAIGWHQWWLEIGQNFMQRDIHLIPQPDRNRVLHWLENGDPCARHSFPHRHFWMGACIWGARSPQVTDYFSGEEIRIIREFSIAVREENNDPAFEEVKEAIAAEPESYFDTWQKTRFHIYIFPGEMISGPFISLNWMRKSHIVMKHTEAYMAKGGDPDILERMAIKYAELHEGGEWTQQYVDDKASFRIANMWSNRFREPQEVRQSGGVIAPDATPPETSIVRYVQQKYRAGSNAEFFHIGGGAEALQEFGQTLVDRDVLEGGIIERLVGRIVANDLHPLQCLRLSQIINDPDEELEGVDKEILIEQVLGLTWPKQLRN